MSEHALLLPCLLGSDGNTERSRAFNLILSSMPWPESDKWYALFKSQAGYAPMWALTLLQYSKEFERRYDQDDQGRSGWITQPKYTIPQEWIDAFHAGLKNDWQTFDSVLGLWELSKAKD